MKTPQYGDVISYRHLGQTGPTYTGPVIDAEAYANTTCGNACGHGEHGAVEMFDGTISEWESMIEALDFSNANDRTGIAYLCEIL